MTIEISDNPELHTQLIAKMGQGVSVSPPDAPKQTDVTSFKALSGASDTDDATKAAALVDEFGNSKNTSALPEVYNAGNTQQADRPASNATQQQDDKISKAEGGDDSSASDKAMTDKMDAEAKKQDKISSLMSRIGQLQQQLSHVEVQISSLQGGGQENASGEDSGAQIGQLSAQRNMLSSMVQSLQQELMAVQSG